MSIFFVFRLFGKILGMLRCGVCGFFIFLIWGVNVFLVGVVVGVVFMLCGFFVDNIVIEDLIWKWWGWVYCVYFVFCL